MQEQPTRLTYTVAQITELARLITEVPSRYRQIVDAAIEVLNQGVPQQPEPQTDPTPQNEQ